MKNLLCISGFLGLAEDWEFLKSPGLTINAHSPQNFLTSSFGEAADKINSEGKHSGSDFLLGYSLGGRLALHALVSNPGQWKAAVIISAHPGLETEKEIQERADQDLKWAKKFADMPWSEVMAQWNAQSVFQGSLLQREEKHFKRSELADLMISFSLAEQRDLRAELKEVQKPILFVAGEKDSKFARLAKEMTYLNVEDFEMWLAPQVGHRVLQSPVLLKAKIEEFLEEHK